MKKAEFYKKALQAIGVSETEAEIAGLIPSDDGEVNFTLPEGSFFTPEDLETRDNSIRNRAKSEAGKAALEIAVKNAKREMGLDFEGKDFNVFVQEVQKKAEADAKVEPSQKVKELTASNEALRAQIQGFETEKAELENKMNSQKLSFEFNKVVSSGLSDITLKDGWSPTYVSQIFRNDYEPVFEDDKLVLKNKSTGEKVLNQKTQLPENPENVLKHFVTEKGMAGEPRKGRGKTNIPVGGGAFSDINNLDDFNAYCESKGINPEGSEGSKLLDTVMRDNKNFSYE